MHLKLWVLILLMLIFLLDYKDYQRAFIHNLAMLNYHSFIANNGSHELMMGLTRIQQAITLKPSNVISQARLASMYLSDDNYNAAFHQAQMVADLARGGNGYCTLGQTNWVRQLSRLSSYRPVELLDFSHPLSVWYFGISNDASASISMEYVANTKYQCVAHLSVSIDRLPNRYAILAQNVEFKSNINYQLSASIKMEGMLRAWLGVRSQWPGLPLPVSAEWQTVTFLFQAIEQPQKDFVYIVIDDGHGILSIRDIRLTEIR